MSRSWEGGIILQSTPNFDSVWLLRNYASNAHNLVNNYEIYWKFPAFNEQL